MLGSGIGLWCWLGLECRVGVRVRARARAVSPGTLWRGLTVKGKGRVTFTSLLHPLCSIVEL